MKKQLSAVLITIILMSSSYPVVFVRSTPIKDASERERALKTSEKHIELTFTLPEVVKAGNYDWLKIPDCSYISTPGHPMLPIRSVAEKLPLNSHITQIAAKVENVSLKEDYSIMPALTPVQADSAEPLNMTEPDPTTYGKDDLYPQEWYTYRIGNGLDPDTNRRVQYATIYLYPLRYLPTQKKILLAQNVSFTITYTEPAEEPTAQTVLKNLIITSDALEPYAVQLAAYKNSTGISSRAVNLTWVYKNYGGIDRPEQIRNCIKGFVAAYGITYVTIFGDADQVPVRYAFVNDTQSGEPFVPTDLYYSDLDGTWDDNNDGIYGDQRYDNVDGIPDVYVGRIPPSLASYAQTAVDKIIGYQQQFNASESWTRRVVLAAGTGSGDGFSNPFGIAFPFLKNYTANININKDIVKLYEAYGNLSTGSMSSEINRGALFVNFAGHGSPGVWLFYWVNPWLGWYNGYGIADVQALTNGFKLPVVTTMACSTARFDDQECIGEWFVLQPNGGSIAYFGSTRIAWGYADQWITTGLMGEIDWRIYQNYYEGYSRLGQMWGQTAKEYVQNHIWNYRYASMYDVKTLMEFILLGDPTLRIYNPAFPETLNVPKDCPTIQGAINAAYDGDTVNVSSGKYYESVVVNKPLILEGENPRNTYIEGVYRSEFLINITSFDVYVQGFTLRNGHHAIHAGDSAHNINITHNLISDNNGGILLASPTECRIEGNTFTSNRGAIAFLGWPEGYDNSIADNVVENQSWDGINIMNCRGTKIVGNYIAHTACIQYYFGGLELWGCQDTIVYHNDFVDNVRHVYLQDSYNTVWNDGYPSGGNYWSDYTGVDAYSGVYQNETGSDGIADMPYVIDASNQDNYPLIHPYGSIQNLNTSLVYLSIQSAINAPETLNGDTIFVRSGVYCEHVVVNKTVSLIGKDKDSTILNGTAIEPIMIVEANDVKISGFTFEGWAFQNILINATTGVTIVENKIVFNALGIDVENSVNTTIENNTINGFGLDNIGIMLAYSSGCSIVNNTITNAVYDGIRLWFSSSNLIHQNLIKDNDYGIFFHEANLNTISENTISESGGPGIYIESSSSNEILHNSFMDNYDQVKIYDNSVNTWDDGYPSGGNYWSCYTGTDLYSGPYQNETGSDGIGDTPYVIDANNRDNYPLTKPYPWGSHDIGVTYIGKVWEIYFPPIILPLKTIVGLGFRLHINVFVMNYGAYSEVFNVTVYANTTAIETITNITLASRNSVILNFTWDTSGFACGNYSIRAYASPVAGEKDTSDNSFSDGMILVTILGDVNGDFKVEGKDIALIAKAYGSLIGQPAYVPNADINNDGKIDGKDIAVAAKYFGTHYP